MNAKVLAVALAMTALAMPATAMAAPSGPEPGNSANAQACQDGWQTLQRPDGTGFANAGDCTSHAAQGGTFGLDPLERCKQELAAAGYTAPADANFVLGTPGDDTLVLTEGADIVCGFEGRDVTGFNPYLREGDVFLGGAGDDYVQTMLDGSGIGGTFEGGDGADGVGAIYDGTVNGGTGNDVVSHLYGGTANGGAGDDLVVKGWFGTFNGGDGDDRVQDLYYTAFNGEAGCDAVASFKTSARKFDPGDQSTCP